MFSGRAICDHEREMLPRFYAGLLRKHPAISATLGCIFVVLLAASIVRGNAKQFLAYLTAVVLSVVVIDIMCLRRQTIPEPIPVRDSGFESLVLIACWVTALVWLGGRFVFNYRPAAVGLRLAWFTIGLGAVFAIIPALFLLGRRYWPADLGLRFRGVTVALPVLAIFATVTFVFSPQSITWSRALAESGSPAGLVQVAVSACLPEEFFRIVWQTRIGTWLKNPATGWLIASIAWAALHGPIDYSQSHSVVEVALGVLNIVPLGLLWGYLTHRTGSFLPSLLLHGLNFWGLQNT
jgi:membrane protease YdiL (CAAX protease family)